MALFNRRSGQGLDHLAAGKEENDRPTTRSEPSVPCSVHVVTAENKACYGRGLEESFRLRHQYYTVENNFLPCQSSGRETDEYDADDAIYFLAFEDQSERLVGSVRLLPTVRKVPLKEYVDLAGSYEVPRAPTTFHFSRMVVAQDRREGQPLNFVRASLRCAVLEYCLDEQIDTLTLLMPMAMLQTFLTLGWNPIPLALPELYRGMSMVVVTVDVSEVALKRTRKEAGIPRNLLIKRGITRPAITTTPYPTWLS